MRSLGAPRLDLIVLGPPSEAVGVVASVVKSQADLLNRDVSNRLESWCVLPQAIVPTTPSEVVFKLSRHVVGGRNLTWLGFYRYATFPRNPRPNTYVGAGVLACNVNPSIVETVSIITKIANSMVDDRNEFAGSAPDFTDQLSRREVSLVARELISGGLEAGADEKFYADLTTVARGDMSAVLTQLLEKGLTAESLADGAELVVGSSLRLKKSALASAAFTLVDRDGQRDRPPVWPAPRSERAKENRTDEGALSNPFRESVPDDGNGPRAGRDGAYGRESVSFEQLDRRIRELETSKRSGNEEAGKRSVNRYVWPIVATALTIASLVIGAVGFKLYDDYREAAASAADVQVDRGSEDALARVVDDGCPLADLEDNSADNVARLRAELECRATASLRMNDRTREVEDALSDLK